MLGSICDADSLVWIVARQLNDQVSRLIWNVGARRRRRREEDVALEVKRRARPEKDLIESDAQAPRVNLIRIWVLVKNKQKKMNDSQKLHTKLATFSKQKQKLKNS